MAQYMKTVGKLAARAAKSQAFDKALSVAASYILSELRLTDLRAKRVLLKQKREHHIHLLGRTTYRLVDSGIEPMTDEHVTTIIRVLEEIDSEIRAVEEEFQRRREFDSAQRKYRSDSANKSQDSQPEQHDAANNGETKK